MSFYPADLARIHDEGFGDFARAAARELLGRLPRNGLVVELGCGTGISSAIISAAGYDVLGIDISEYMLEIARKRAPRAKFRRASIWDTDLPSAIAVTAIGEVLNYAADERAGPDGLTPMFERIDAALEAGGLFLFDFATPGRATLASGGATVREGDGWRIEADTSEDPETRMLERRMTIERHGERRTEVHRLHLYEPEFVQKCLEGLGFRCEALDGYSDFGFWPGYAAYAAVKPSFSVDSRRR